MGNTRAWPVLRTTDLEEAFALAERLLSIASWNDPTRCDLVAEAQSADVLQRLVSASPEAKSTPGAKDSVGLPTGVSLRAATAAEAHARLNVWSEITSCYLLWHNLRWPPVPELGLGESYKYAELEIACHSRDIRCSQWAPEHTVYVHVAPGDDERPAWLAAQIGTSVVGSPEHGW